MYAQLCPGGVLVLEPQGWGSYGRKKNLTVCIFLVFCLRLSNIFTCTYLIFFFSYIYIRVQNHFFRLLQERIYKNYQSIEFFPNKFTQYLLSPEVGFSKCEVVSIPPHPSKGFQRPIQLFTKVASSITENTENLENVNTSALSSASVESNQVRHERRDQQQDLERRQYERDLFPKDNKEGNMSEISQQSGESINQYDQLENVYAPSATPCYDTPGHNNDNSQPMEMSKMCYVDVNIEHHKVDLEAQDVNNSKHTKESASHVSCPNKSNVEHGVKETQKVMEYSDNKDDVAINNKVGMKRPANDDKKLIDEDIKNLKKTSLTLRINENKSKTQREQVEPLQNKNVIKDKCIIEKIHFRSLEKTNESSRLYAVQSSKKSFHNLDGVQVSSNTSNNEGSLETQLTSKSDFRQDNRNVATNEANDKSANENQQVRPCP